MEVELKGIQAKPSRKTIEFTFLVTNDSKEVKFTAASYQKMIEWMAVLNTVSLQLSENPPDEEKDLDEVLSEIFHREYEPLLYALQIDIGQSSLSAFIDRQTPVVQPEEKSLFRTNSIGEDGFLSVQYEILNTSVRNPFQIHGITLDKLVERLSDIYGPDHDFSTLIIYCYRAFVSPVKLIEKCKCRINPTFTEKDAAYLKWKPIIRLRYYFFIRIISFIQKWASTFWFPDFMDVSVKQGYNQFVDLITSSFGVLEEDQLLDQKYLVKFGVIKSYMYKYGVQDKMDKVDRRRSNLSMCSSSRASLFLDHSPIPSITEKPKSKLEFLDVNPDEMTMAFTLREQEILSLITPASLANHLWGSHKDSHVVDQIKPINDSVLNFNTISYWVATEICTQPGISF
jgi:hypothetical protein